MGQKKSTSGEAGKPDHRVGLARARRLANVELDPRWLAIEEFYTIPELLSVLPKKTVKQAFDAKLLDQIAQRKAEGRGYMDLAVTFGKTQRQLINYTYYHRRDLKS